MRNRAMKRRHVRHVSRDPADKRAEMKRLYADELARLMRSATRKTPSPFQRQHAKELAEKRYERERVYRLLYADPRFQRLEKYKDDALRNETHAESMYLVTKWPQDRERLERATRSRKRALRAFNAYIDRFFARHGVKPI